LLIHKKVRKIDDKMMDMREKKKEAHPKGGKRREKR
jgi:hypothetical protein